MRKLFYTLIKKNPLLRHLSRVAYTVLVRLRYLLTTVNVKTDSHCVLFGAFNGKSYCDSPKQIFLRMVQDDCYKDYRFIWVFDRPEKYMILEQYPNTRVIKTKSTAYERALKESGTWITNFRIDYYLPNKQQRYVQCWHGTPLKKLGCDIDYCNNSLNSVKEFREKYMTDGKKFTHIVSPSPFTTEKFISAFNLKAYGKENAVMEMGYPRNDPLYTYTPSQAELIRDSLKIPMGKKIILYAPTWRDNSHVSGVGYFFQPEADFKMLKEKFGDRAVILFRAHIFIASAFDFDKYGGFVYNVSDYDDIADLYIVSDVLVTDYSSVFFDYANLSRPIIFYMYDLESYIGQIRDFYFPLSELPGDIVKTSEELADALDNVFGEGFTPDERYRSFKRKFNPLDDGNASLRVIDKLFAEGEIS